MTKQLHKNIEIGFVLIIIGCVDGFVRTHTIDQIDEFVFKRAERTHGLEGPFDLLRKAPKPPNVVKRQCNLFKFY